MKPRSAGLRPAPAYLAAQDVEQEWLSSGLSDRCCGSQSRAPFLCFDHLGLRQDALLFVPRIKMNLLTSIPTEFI